MGNSASARAKEAEAEEAFLRSLGDRYPLGDAELRKWCWIHSRLSSATHPPVAPIPSSSLSLLAVWSAVYGTHDPSRRRSSDRLQDDARDNPIEGRINAANTVLEAMRNVEEQILPKGLSCAILRRALGISLNSALKPPPLADDPFLSAKSLANPDDISAFEESYYSIANASASPSLEAFFGEFSKSCGRRGSRAALSKLFEISSSAVDTQCPGHLLKAEASDVIRIAYSLTLAAMYLKAVAESMNNPKEIVDGRPKVRDFVPHVHCGQSMVDSLVYSAEEQRQGGGGVRNPGLDSCPSRNCICLEEFLEWASTTAPMMSSLPTFLIVLFNFFSASSDWKKLSLPPGVAPLWMPSFTIDVTMQSANLTPSVFFPYPSSASFELFSVCCTSLVLASGRWHRLFSSEVNGLSCNRLMDGLLGYGGPNIILIRSKNGSVFGFYTSTPWSQESGSYYGNSDCFLFRLGPDRMSVYRPKGGIDTGMQAHNYMYFNPEARSKGFDALPHGIGFGGTADSQQKPRLFIDEVLDGCQAAPTDLTFEEGPLLSGAKEYDTSLFEVEAMEAWGVGTSETVGEALLARDGRREQSMKKKKQALAAKGTMLEDLQSGMHGNKIFQHKDQINERDEGCAMDKTIEKE